MPHGSHSPPVDNIAAQTVRPDQHEQMIPMRPEAIPAATAASTWHQVLSVLSDRLQKPRNGNRKRRSMIRRPQMSGAEMLEPRMLMDGAGNVAAEIGMPLGEGEGATVVSSSAASATSLREQIATLEESHETVTRIPSLTVTAFRNDTKNVTLTYTFMPEDIAFQFGNQTLALPEGSGSILFPLNAFSQDIRKFYTAKLIRPSTGEVVYGNVGEFSVAKGGHRYAMFKSDIVISNSSLTNLSRTEILPFTAEKVAQIETLKK